MTKKKKFKFHAKTQEQIKDIDYWSKLSEDERQWLNEFHDGSLNNNHRKYKMFTEHPEYQDRIKTEIYGEVNSRNRDIYSDMKVRNRLDSLDELHDTVEESVVSSMLLKQMSKKEKEALLINFGIKTFEECIRDLISTTVFDIRSKPDEIDSTYLLLNFYITANALIKEEIKQRKKDNSKVS